MNEELTFQQALAETQALTNEWERAGAVLLAATRAESMPAEAEGRRRACEEQLATADQRLKAVKTSLRAEDAVVDADTRPSATERTAPAKTEAEAAERAAADAKTRLTTAERESNPSRCRPENLVEHGAGRWQHRAHSEGTGDGATRAAGKRPPVSTRQGLVVQVLRRDRQAAVALVRVA